MRYLCGLIIALSVVGCTGIPSAQVQPPSHENSSAIVTDIDGTLTPNVMAINEVRPDAAKAIRDLANKGYKIIYVTARLPLFQAGLPKWLQKNGFPKGDLQVAQSNGESSHPEIFKARVLKDYVRHGWRLEYAYGDSSTDFAAYAEAGIPKERVFALKRRGSENCQKGVYQQCLNGWTEYLPYIEKKIVNRNN